MLDLINQYNLLTDEEKNIILIYKTKIGYFVNKLNSIDEKEDIKIYEEYKNIIDLDENKFIKFGVFKDINFETFEEFIKSIKNISLRLEDLKGKIKLNNDLKLYRATTVRKKEQILNISNDNLISTTLNLDVTDNFYTFDGIDVLYQIKVYKNTPCLITPYSIKKMYIGDKPILKIIKNDDQQEIILFKDSINYNVINQKYISEENLFVVKIDTEVIKTNKY